MKPKLRLISLIVDAVVVGLILQFASCQSVKKWEIAHRPQIEKSLYLVGHDVGGLAVRMFIGGMTNGKFTLASAVTSVEGDYISSNQITELADVWQLPPADAKPLALIAADLANHPPANKDEAVARIEGYAAGIRGDPLPAGVVK